MHPNLETLLASLKPKRILALTTKGKRSYEQVDYCEDDLLIFGPETRGLPAELIEGLPAEQRIRIPMLPNSRSMNLSNACSLIVYEAWKQLGFSGAALPPIS